MRKTILATDQYYHLYNRGVDKREVFLGTGYYSRFLSLIQHYLQFDYPYSLLILQLKRAKSPEEKHFILANLNATRRIKAPLEIIAFCLMPNHYHLTVKQLVENGISNFMHRIGTGFTNYFNLRLERSGRLFEGPFKAKLVETDEQLLHLSRYQHINPQKLDNAYHNLQNLIEYPWSSLAIYADPESSKGRLNFVNPGPILDFFKNREDYLNFVEAEIDNFEAVRLHEITVDDDFGWFSKFRALEKKQRQDLIELYLEASLKHL